MDKKIDNKSENRNSLNNLKKINKNNNIEKNSINIKDQDLNIK